jgi:hypothetical protein
MRLRMDIKAIYKNRRDWASWALAAVAVLLGVLVVAKVVSLVWSTARARAVVGLAVAGNGEDPNGLQRHLAQAKGVADALKQKNLFIRQPPKESPVKQVEGILGSEVLVSGKWYKVGDKIGDAKVVEIRPTEVRIEWDGKTTSFSPMAAVSAAPPGPPAVPKELKKEEGPAPPKPPEGAPSAVKAPAAPADDPLAWMGVELPAKVREKLLEHWNKASDKEKEQMKEKWNNMSNEERQQAMESMRNM